MKIIDKQSSFNTGIVTHKLRARDDLKQYTSGVADALNFFTTKYGPLIKRTGTQFKWNTKHVGEKVFLIPFVFSIKQSLVLEFLANKIRFYTFDGISFGPIADPNDTTKQYEIETPFTDEILDQISYVQSLDVIYLAFSDGKTRPMELRRYANNDWKLVDYSFEDGPYLDQNYDGNKTIKIEKTTTGVLKFTTKGFEVTEDDIGRHVRVNHVEEDTLEDRWGWGIIESITGANSGTINMKQKAWATSETSDFRLGAWSNKLGWPTLCNIHEQRLVWAGITNYPWIWASNSFNYHNFSPSDYSGEIKDSNAIYYNMSTDKVAPVKWLASLGSLIIGTEMYEMRMYSAGAGLSPKDVVVKKETTYGVHNAQPVITDDTCIFIQRLQRKLRAISYDYTRDAYVGPELTTLSESLTVSGMKRIVHQREPNDLVWCLMEDGSLLILTYDKEQTVQGWTRATIAGKNAKVIDLVSLPSATYKQDVVVMLVERDINGTRQRYMEILSKELQDHVDIKDVPYLDSALTYKGNPTTAISGLEHLEGETVIVTNAGGLHEKVKVIDGTVSFRYPVSDCWIGLPYEAYFETLERDISNLQVSVKIARTRIHKLVLYLLNTLGLTVTQKSRGITTQLITFTPLSNMDTPPQLFSGQQEHDIMTAWTNSDMSYSLHFESEPALPCTVAGIYTGVEINAL